MAKRTVQSLAQWAQRRASGLCCQCGNPVEKPPLALCDLCRLRHNEQCRASWSLRQAKRKAAGLAPGTRIRARQEGSRRCWDCGGTVQTQFVRCDVCRLTLNAQRRRSRPIRKSEGRCFDCGKKTTNSYVRCTLCRVKTAQAKAAMYMRRLELGLCRECGKKTEGYYTRCDAHRALLETKRHIRDAERKLTAKGRGGRGPLKPTPDF